MQSNSPTTKENFVKKRKNEAGRVFSRCMGPIRILGLHNGAVLGYAKGFLGRVEFIYVESIPMRWSEWLT